VIIAGVQARTGEAAEALEALADHLACPVMTTYKAKGVYPDGAPRHAGLFTGAKTEAPWLADADLLILYGVDPVELVASPWPYEMPVLELAEVEVRPHYTDIAAALFGPLPALAESVKGAGQPANWSDAPRPITLPEDGSGDNDGISPLAVVRATIDAAPAEARITIDAGAHMLAPMALWPAKKPFDVQISNGLSTMGFALPAAIASALAEPERPVIAFTGDGGLAMCLAELATLARHDLPVTVVVFNDAALSLIDLKQRQRGFETAGVRYPSIDMALIGVGANLNAVRADTEADLRAALANAFESPGPALIDARVDPSGYRAMFEAIRGAPTQATQT
jgi:acetolactate synthase-1/2/3 large subunit